MRHLEKRKCLYVMCTQELLGRTSRDEVVEVAGCCELRRPSIILKVMGRVKGVKYRNDQI